MTKVYPTWVLLLIILLLVFILIFISVSIARHTTIPLSGGSIGSGEIAAKTLKWYNTNTDDYDLVAVLIEYEEGSFEDRIENYLAVLPDHTHFQVYHTAKEAEVLSQSKIGKYIDEGKVELFNMGVENLTPLGYSKLFCSLEFWNSIRSEKVVVCQSNYDGNKDINIKDFVKYDFIGAPYSKHLHTGWHTLFMIKGWNINAIFLNGERSIRSKSKSIEVLEQYPWDEKTPENIWFSAFLPKVNAHLPNLKNARKFNG